MSSFAVNTDSRRRRAEAQVRVVICAASASTRAELELLLEQQSSIEVVGAAPSTKHLRPMLAETDPDVVFLHLESISDDMSWILFHGFGVIVVLFAIRTHRARPETASRRGGQA